MELTALMSAFTGPLVDHLVGHISVQVMHICSSGPVGTEERPLSLSLHKLPTTPGGA